MPKLPADLPENWTQGQTISPNGTEVGLTEKHGYNYLMKQVNNTQTEVNNINEALPDVAQQATVEDIKNKIGTEGDADTQPTLFGRLAQLKNVLLENLAEVLTKVTGIDEKIGTSEDTSGSATLFGQIKQNYSGLDVFDTIRMKKEVVTVNVPSGSGKYTGTFNFSKGKKKIKAIIFGSSGFQTTSGTYIFEVDGTEYKFSASGGNLYDAVFAEFMTNNTSSRVLDLSSNNSTSYTKNPLRVVVKDSFSVTMPIKRVESSGQAKMIIYYE